VTKDLSVEDVQIYISVFLEPRILMKTSKIDSFQCPKIDKKTVKTGENRPVLKVQPDQTGNRQTGRSGIDLPVRFQS
jgi:hypothetical protein